MRCLYPESRRNRPHHHFIVSVPGMLLSLSISTVSCDSDSCLLVQSGSWQTVTIDLETLIWISGQNEKYARFLGSLLKQRRELRFEKDARSTSVLFLVVIYSRTHSLYISGTVAGSEIHAEAALQRSLFSFGSRRGRERGEEKQEMEKRLWMREWEKLCGTLGKELMT